MRKFSLFLLTSLALLLAACGGQTTTTTTTITTTTTTTTMTTTTTKDPSKIVDSVEVLEYENLMYYGQEYNESSVQLEVTFKDGHKTVYSGDQLVFDYADFDYYSYGEQTIGVRVIGLNASTKITVDVQKRSIKVLMIANSFGDDTVQWCHEIADELGIDFTIANLYIGGCVLSTHLTNLQGDKKAYEFVTYNKNTQKWSRKASTAISTALLSDDWDYVSLQQGSYDSGRAESYNTIDMIMDEVLKIKPDVEFIWNMTWAYQTDSGHANFGIYNHDQMTMYNGIINAVQTKVVPNERFKYVVPNGTAVQNARTSYYGDTFCRDVYCHLTYDFGRYIAGLTMVATVSGMSIENIQYSPNLEPLQKMVAIESAMNALANPFVITQSKY